MKRIWYMLILAMGFSSCIETVNTYDKLPPGMWRGELVLENRNFTPQEGDEEVQVGNNEWNEGSLPFNFEVSYSVDGELQAELINGEERIPIKEILYGRNQRIAKDSIRFVFPEYDSYLKANYEDNALQGSFVITSKDNYTIPFRGYYGQSYRFTPVKKEPKADLTGKWEVTFEEGTEDEYKAIGEFKQEGNELTGTFRTETGDYRYLEGTVQDNKAYLSVFDGTHAFLFTMKIMNEDELIGSFRSGTHYKATWKAKRNANFELADPKDLTYLTEENAAIQFSFPNANGELIGLEDTQFENKAKIVSIMGTWCPNCKDEMNYLKDIQKKYNNDVAVVAIAFERYRDQAKALSGIERYSKTMDLNFPILHGGLASKPEASKAFPQLNKIISFPTIIMMDRTNKVQYIHTGFNGPATSKYREFTEEFEAELESLIK